MTSVPRPLVVLLLTATAQAAAASGGLTNLTVDWTPANSAVVEGQQPIVRWVIPHNASRPPGTVQRSYRFQLQQPWSVPGPGIAFDSGAVASTETAAQYPGAYGSMGDRDYRPALLPDTAYAFMLEVALSDGSVIKGGGGLKTGLQSDSRSAWDGAEWIVGDAALPTSPGARKNNLRAEWTLEAVPSSASVFVAGIGYHELYLLRGRYMPPKPFDLPLFLGPFMTWISSEQVLQWRQAGHRQGQAPAGLHQLREAQLLRTLLPDTLPQGGEECAWR